MLTESLLILIIIALACGLVYLLQDTWPFSIAYTSFAPLITQLQSLASGLLAGPLGLWNQAQTQVPWVDDAVKMGGTSAITASILKYFGNKAKAKLENTLQQKTSELKNHTSEILTLETANERLKTQRDDVLILASELKEDYNAKLVKKDEMIEALKKREQTLIQERNAALSIDKQKIVDEVKDEVRKH